MARVAISGDRMVPDRIDMDDHLARVAQEGCFPLWTPPNADHGCTFEWTRAERSSRKPLAQARITPDGKTEWIVKDDCRPPPLDSRRLVGTVETWREDGRPRTRALVWLVHDETDLPHSSLLCFSTPAGAVHTRVQWCTVDGGDDVCRPAQDYYRRAQWHEARYIDGVLSSSAPIAGPNAVPEHGRLFVIDLACFLDPSKVRASWSI